MPPNLQVVPKLRAFCRAHPRTAEVAIVVGLVVALEFIVFRGYFTGSAIPHFDFMGGYNTEAFAWWHDGSFFDPPQWMHYMWGGYPAVANLQNSSYYLPVGLTSSVTDFTLHASAVLSALHVAFGAVGTYVFLRRWGARIGPALVGLAAWFFAPGFFAHATLLDIMRGYAWLPWVMLITSVKWPWRTAWWSIPLAALMLWQTMLGAYPGQLVAIAYTLPVWIIANQLRDKPKITRYLMPLAIATVSAVLMTMLRFLPALIERGKYPLNPDESRLTFGMLGTLLYSEINDRNPWFDELSSWFLPAVMVALLLFAPLSSRLVRALLAVGGLALMFGLPIWPWHDLLPNLPALDYSRFRIADFRFVTLFCAVAVAVFTLQHMLTQAPAAKPRTERQRWIPVVAVVAVLALFGYIGVHYSYDAGSSRIQWGILVVSSVLLIAIAWQRIRVPPAAVTAVVVALVVISGVTQANATKMLWTEDRTVVEHAYYGASVDDLVARRDDNREFAQRPSRISPPPFYNHVDVNDFHTNAVFYSGRSSVIGYLNLKATETYQIIRLQIDIRGDHGLHASAFWSAAGMVIEGLPDTMPDPDATEACATDFVCGDNLAVEPLSYETSGHFGYHVTVSAPTAVMLNEAHYSGWQAVLCDANATNNCQNLATARGTSGQITLDLPEGDWTLTLDYRLPRQQTAWFLFYLGVFAALAAGAAVAVSRNSRARRWIASRRRVVRHETTIAEPITRPVLERTLGQLVIVAVLASGVVGVLTQRNLYQDGPNFLWQSVRSESFFSEHRHLAHWVTQLPLVAALKLGVTQLWLLSYIQAIGIILLPFAVWAVALHVIRRHPMFWPMVMVFAATFLNSTFFSIGEYNFATAFMALSFSLLLRGDLGRRSIIALGVVRSDAALLV